MRWRCTRRSSSRNPSFRSLLMDRVLKTLVSRPDAFLPHQRRIEHLFGAMDRFFQETARRYGFACTGCEDSCCRTRFYHFTLVEYLFLHEGFLTLSPDLKNAFSDRALDYRRQMEAADEAGTPFRNFCPLNRQGLCALYRWRPMICRLHGLPNEVHMPGRLPLRGPGCPTFEKTLGQVSYIPFDRTPFYRDMARCEQALRTEVEADRGIRMTVADMLVDYGNHNTGTSNRTPSSEVKISHEIS